MREASPTVRAMHSTTPLACDRMTNLQRARSVRKFLSRTNVDQLDLVLQARIF